MSNSFRLPVIMLAVGAMLGAGVTLLPGMLGVGDDATRSAGVSGSTAPARLAPPPPNSLVYSEDEVNAQVARNLREIDQPLPVKDLHVALLDNNRVQATGRAVLPLRGETPLTVLMTVGSADGRLKINVESVKAGSVPLPQPMVQQLVNQVKGAAGINDLENIALPRGYESVTVEQGRVVVKKRT